MVSTLQSKDSKRTAQRDHTPAISSPARDLDGAILMLEAAVFDALDVGKTRQYADSDERYWDRTLKSIATPVSLALAEYRGPRRMHYAYDEGKHAMAQTLLVTDSPLHVLVRVCEEALVHCEEWGGVHAASITHDQQDLEHALRGFLKRYKTVSRKRNGNAPAE